MQTLIKNLQISDTENSRGHVIFYFCKIKGKKKKGGTEHLSNNLREYVVIIPKEWKEVQ